MLAIASDHRRAGGVSKGEVVLVDATDNRSCENRQIGRVESSDGNGMSQDLELLSRWLYFQLAADGDSISLAWFGLGAGKCEENNRSQLNVPKILEGFRGLTHA